VSDKDSPNMPKMAAEGLEEKMEEMLLDMPKLPAWRTITRNSSKCACCALPHAAAHSP
jgi:hypothetical protein